jgi:chromosomal replication initiator protein
MQVQYLHDHCRLAFAEAAQAALGKLVTAEFESDEAEMQPAGDGIGFEDGQLRLNRDYVFENFVTGPCNRLAHAAAQAVAENPGTTYNPFFIYGGVGLGKTHLLQAIYQESARLGKCTRAMYISCETFTNHFIEAVERGALKEFRYRYRHADMLVIDDIQFLAEAERSQEEFFHTFNTLYQSRKQIILSADCSPAGLPSMENRLVSRFNSGLVAVMEAPCLETRMAILRKKARIRCIEVPEDVIRYVATQFASNIRDLEGALVKLDALSHTRSGTIDMAIAREAFGEDPTGRNGVTMEMIMDAVIKHYGVRLGDLQGKKRTKSVTLPRQICMYLARELTKLSLEEIGGFFGGRDHTTVLHAERVIGAGRGTDSQLNASLDRISMQLRSGRVLA